MIHCLQHILRAGIHGLSALDNIIHIQSAEDLRQTVADGYRNETGFFPGLAGLRSLCGRLFLHFLLSSHTGSLTNQLLLMLFAHVVNLHAGQAAVSQSLLNRKTGIVRVYMYLHDLIIRNYYDGITDRFEISLEGMFLLQREFLLQINDKLGAVTELNIAEIRGSRPCGSLLLCCGLLLRCLRCLDLLAKKSVVGALQYLDQTLSARIHNSRLLQYRKHIRGTA